MPVHMCECTGMCMCVPVHVCECTDAFMCMNCESKKTVSYSGNKEPSWKDIKGRARETTIEDCHKSL